jgi:iron complex transport system permease protein
MSDGIAVVEPSVVTPRRRDRRWPPVLPLAIVGLLVCCGLFAPWLTPHSPVEGSLGDRLVPPIGMEGSKPGHPLGTDRLGRDTLSRLLYGARVSLVVGLFSVVLAGLVGATLAVAGAAYQGVFRNALADPYLLGAAAGAGLGATLVIAYFPAGIAWPVDPLPVAAFVGALAGVAAAYVLGRSASSGRSTAALILAGVTVASFLTAIQTFVQQQHSQSLQEVYAWILGHLDTAGWHDVGLVSPYIAVSAAVILLHRRVLDVLSVGDEEAASLGVNVTRTRLVVVVFATVGTAAAVAISGLIGFVGIIVPHAVRLVLGPSYRLILPLSLLGGAGFLVLADVIARSVLSPAELPIGVVTAFFGAPFFAVVLRTSRSFT